MRGVWGVCGAWAVVRVLADVAPVLRAAEVPRGGFCGDGAGWGTVILLGRLSSTRSWRGLKRRLYGEGHGIFLSVILGGGGRGGVVGGCAAIRVVEPVKV